MLFSRDGIPNPFHRKVQQEDKMVNPQGQDVITDRGNIKHTLEGAGISDLSEQFGGLNYRGTEFNFVSLHINTVTTMGMIRLVALFVGLLLSCSSKDCWHSIWRAMTCCRCTMGSKRDQLTYKSSMSTGSAKPLAIAMASAPTQGEIDSLE